MANDNNNREIIYKGLKRHYGAFRTLACELMAERGLTLNAATVQVSRVIREGILKDDELMLKAARLMVQLNKDQEAKADPLFLGKAYQKSQPTTLFHGVTFEEEQDEFKKNQKKL